MEDDNQKMIQLVPFYKLNPAKFYADYEAFTEEYLVSIKVATQLGVLVMTSKDAKLKIGAEMTTLMEFKGEKEEERINMLTYYFLGDQNGMMNYSRMQGESDVKKIDALK